MERNLNRLDRDKILHLYSDSTQPTARTVAETLGLKVETLEHIVWQLKKRKGGIQVRLPLEAAWDDEIHAMDL